MRKIIAITLVLVAVGIGVVVLRPKTAHSSDTNSPAVLGSTTQSSTPTVTSTPSPTATMSTQTEKPPLGASCSSVYSTAKNTAQSFMNAHKARTAETVLNMLSIPVNPEDVSQHDFLDGSDTGEGARLYVLAQFAYTTKSYSFGTFTNNGDDPVNRGARLCLLTVYETRISTAAETYTENTETRYLEFSLDELGNITLQSFKDGRSGAKYSGFN